MVGLRSTGLPECGPTESSAPEPILFYFKTSFFEWFEVKVCILKSEAVINDQNRVLSFGTPVYLSFHCFYINYKIKKFIIVL